MLRYVNMEDQVTQPLAANFPIMISALPRRGRYGLFTDVTFDGVYLFSCRLRLTRFPPPCRRNRKIAWYTPDVRQVLIRSIMITGPFLGDRIDIERSISRAKDLMLPLVGQRVFEQILTQPEASPRIFMAIPRAAIIRMHRVMENEWPRLFHEDIEHGGHNETERVQLNANLIAVESQSGLHRLFNCIILFNFSKMGIDFVFLGLILRLASSHPIKT